MLKPDHLNAYIEKAERAFFRRCGVCRRRRFFALWHEVYALGDACNGRCKDTCATGWTHACSECTLKVAGGCLRRVQYARDTLRIETLDEALDQFDCERKDDTLGTVYARIEALQKSIEADQQENGY